MNTIDYRKSRWGHNHYFEPKDDGTYSGPCWSRQKINVGDTILWRTNYGHAEATVLAVKAYRDPSDMFLVTSLVVKRIADSSIVSQAELDEAFNETTTIQ